jgi:hypothetical protein
LEEEGGVGAAKDGQVERGCTVQPWVALSLLHDGRLGKVLEFTGRRPNRPAIGRTRSLNRSIQRPAC